MTKKMEQLNNNDSQDLAMARGTLGRVKEMDLTLDQKKKVMEMIGNAVKLEKAGDKAKALAIYSELKQFLTIVNSMERKSEIDYENFECLKNFEGHKDRVNSVLETKDAKYIISGGSDNNIIVRDRITGQEVKNLKEHTKLIHKLKETEDGRYILSTSNDGTIKMWEKESWKCARTFGKEDKKAGDKAVMDVVELDDHTLASISNAVISIWDKGTGREYAGLYPKGMTTSFYGLEKISGSEPRLLITSDKSAGIFDITSKEWIVDFGEDSTGTFVAKQSNDHKSIFTATDYLSDEPYKIQMMSGFDLPIVAEFKGHNGEIRGILQTKDGTHLITCARDRTIKVWDIATQECIKTFELDNFIPTCITESVNGDIIAGGEDSTVRIFGEKK